MLPFQERVIEEKKELDDKIEKLKQFFNTAIYQNLPKDERRRLSRQYTYMEGYSNVLKERIDNFVS
jgi:hypothetical protein